MVIVLLSSLGVRVTQPTPVRADSTSFPARIDVLLSRVRFSQPLYILNLRCIASSDRNLFGRNGGGRCVSTPYFDVFPTSTHINAIYPSLISQALTPRICRTKLLFFTVYTAYLTATLRFPCHLGEYCNWCTGIREALSCDFARISSLGITLGYYTTGHYTLCAVRPEGLRMRCYLLLVASGSGCQWAFSLYPPQVRNPCSQGLDDKRATRRDTPYPFKMSPNVERFTVPHTALDTTPSTWVTQR